MAVNLEQFSQHLRRHALPPFGQGRCAEYVRRALQAAGAKIEPPYVGSARDYGPVMLRLGFRQIVVVDPGSFNFRRGDVMVMQPYAGGRPYGHIAGFDGENWISDHVQKDFWAGPGYRKQRPSHAVYRY